MMTVKRVVLVGLGPDSQSRELLSWAIVKVAEPGDCVIVIHLCNLSDNPVKEKAKLDAYLRDYKGLCELQNLGLECKLFAGLSMRKALVDEAAITAPVAVVVGADNRGHLRGRISTAKYCGKHLPSAADVWCIHKGKIVYSRVNRESHSDPKLDRRLGIKFFRRNFSMDVESEFGDSVADTDISSCGTQGRLHENGVRRSASLFGGDALDQRPGWPLLANPSHRRKVSVVEWVMNLPDRSLVSSCETGPHRHPKNLYTILCFSDAKCLSYEKLKIATCGFHSGNLIGNGATNRVYRGVLDGKHVAVRIQKASEEARKNFSLEMEIVSSIKHRSITELVGICIEDTSLISVYDYKSGGTLAENLQEKKKKSSMSWEVRYKIAIAVAEAVNHFHNECSKPVIHRDIKSSNILLSDKLAPHLSDFGLAIWGSQTGSSFIIQEDAVGTFGYMAPEYFMHGKVSDKIDIYAFGVVLLELMSGRKPIDYNNSKGQESLVLWAKPILESNNLRRVVDPDLLGHLDKEQLKRMGTAARLCLASASRLRPKMSEILELLRGNWSGEKWSRSRWDHDEEEDDDVHPISRADLHLRLAMLGVEDDDSSSPEQTNRPTSEFWKGR